jgi:hypothetical protein
MKLKNITHDYSINGSFNGTSGNTNIIVEDSKLDQIKAVSPVGGDLEAFPFEYSHQNIWKEMESQDGCSKIQLDVSL